jgi:hypothetical protein
METTIPDGDYTVTL